MPDPEDLVSVLFEQVTVPIHIIRNGRSIFLGNYFVDIQVDADGDENAASVSRKKNKLTQAFISKISRISMMREDSPAELDFDKASRILLEVAQEEMGKDVVVAVNVTNAMRISRSY